MNFICATCGTQFPGSVREPLSCAICLDERQYVGLDGQRWTTLEALRRDHHNSRLNEEPGLTSFHTEPGFGIGQRAFLVESPGGNILWDCLTLLDQATADFIQGRGGLAAIAISHPHYYTTMVEWSREFGGAPIFLHEGDRQWVMRPDSAIEFWNGSRKLLADGLTLIRCGGHFDGGAVLYWPAGAEGRGALLSGDILQVVPDRRWVSFMYSYPNYVPLNARAVRTIAAAVEPVAFDRIYGAFPKMTIRQDAKSAVERSVARYLRAIAE